MFAVSAVISNCSRTTALHRTRSVFFTAQRGHRLETSRFNSIDQYFPELQELVIHLEVGARLNSEFFQFNCVVFPC